MSQVQLFTSREIGLDKSSIMVILEFLPSSELNNLASLIYHSKSQEIEQELYNQSILSNIEFGKVLLIYSWNDWFWRVKITEKIKRINKFLPQSIDAITLPNEDKNYRAHFLKQVWMRVDSEKNNHQWKSFQKKREERREYLLLIPLLLSQFAVKSDSKYAKACEKVITQRVNEQFFIEESSLSLNTPLTGPITPLSSLRTYSNQRYDNMKWVSVGMQVGKTSLIMKVVLGRDFNVHAAEYMPRVNDGFSTSVSISYQTANKEDETVIVNVGFWDSVGNEEFDRFRLLIYPETDLFTLIYAINNWSSLTCLVERLIWGCIHVAPTASLVVISTKNDLMEELYWKSLFDSTVEEPISKEEGLLLTKSLGAISKLAHLQVWELKVWIRNLCSFVMHIFSI